MRECNNCHWEGMEADCVGLGTVGPLCPECNETTCYTDEYLEFLDLMEEGHTRAQAAVLSGWKGAEEV